MKDIDKLKEAIEGGLEVYEDISAALEDGKISLIEGGTLVVKHGGKAMRFIGSIKEIGEEIKDLDGEEVSEISDILIDYFGGTDEVRDAVRDISIGAGRLNQGIQKLIALKE